MKKRKLNSKNPKYKKDNEEKLVVLKKVKVNNVILKIIFIVYGLKK